MVYTKTIIRVADNSGAKYIKVLSPFTSGSKKVGVLGDPLLVVPKKLKKKKKRSRQMIQKRKKYIGLLILSNWQTRRRDGSFIKFLSFRVALFTFKNKFLGSSLRSVLPKEFKKGNRFVEYRKMIRKAKRFV